MTDTGNNIAAVRKFRGLSASGLADASGVSRRSVNAYEAGTRMPTYPSLAALAKALDVPVGDLAEPGEMSAQHAWWPTEEALRLVRRETA
jgi:transcriptional regulator with XRE-family HTH domain